MAGKLTKRSVVLRGAVASMTAAALLAGGTATATPARPPSRLRGPTGDLTGRQRAEWFEGQRHLEMVMRRLAPATALAAPAVRPAAVSDVGTVQHVRRISRDTLPAQGSSEQDTQVEPDVAVDPNNDQIVVAVFQQGRYPDGGSVDPGYATSHDGGVTWKHGNLPKLTKAVGGSFARASDPAVAFGPDGSVYAQTLPFDSNDCRNGIAVQRSDDGGLTFAPPVLAQDDTSCSYFNDKNWIAVDTFASSPHIGRIYSVWDRGDQNGQPIVLKYSDGRGATWSSLINVSGASSQGIGALPLVQPNGDLTVVYDRFSGADTEVAQTSHDGGLTFDPAVVIGQFRGSEPSDMRTGGLPAAAVDPTTGHLFVAWQDTRFRSDGLNDIVLSSSSNGGATWSALAKVNPDAQSKGIDHFTPAVAAYGGFVHVTYRTRAGGSSPSLYVGMRYRGSADEGATWGAELTLGAPSDLTYAAQAGGKFLGDYMGLAASANAVHALWCRSAKPPVSEPYHQTAWTGEVVK
jgi:hypothetical protein